MSAERPQLNPSLPDPKKRARQAMIGGLVFAGIYLYFGIYFQSNHKEFLGWFAIFNAVLFLLGSVLVLNGKHSPARVLWLIAGILGIPLGLVMIVLANRMAMAVKAAPTEKPVDSTPSPPTSAISVDAPQPPLSEAARLINTFVAPGSTFADIRRNQSWWVPWLLISVSAVGFFMVLGQKVGYEQIARNEIQKSSRYEQFERLPPEQRQRQMQVSVSITRYIGYAAPVTTIIIFVIAAAVLMACFNFGAGAEVSFKQALAISFYAALPMVLFYVLGIASLLIGVDPDGFNVRNPVATNPAYFMDPTQNKFLYGLVSGFDVFAFWSIVLTGIGYASVSKLKRSTAIGIVAGIFVVYKLAAAALGSLG